MKEAFGQSAAVILRGDVEGMPVSAIDGWMDDSSGNNIPELGHRRWQLNPTLGKVGFGYCDGVAVETIYDRSGAGCDYDFISWPASGNFPQNLFRWYEAWSITLNPQKYAMPAKEDLTVTLEDSAGKTWTFSGDQTYINVGNGPYFNVSLDEHGVSNCIIFRPNVDDIMEYDGIYYDGIYTVTVEGLKDLSGRAVDLAYQVEFFDASPGIRARDRAGDRAGNSAGDRTGD